MLYKGKPSNAENFFQCMDVLCLLPPLSFVTTTASWAWWWYVNMNSGMRSWGLSLFSGVYSGTTKNFLTLSITSRWNNSIVNKQNEWPAAYICISYTHPLYISSIFFSLSTEDATLGISHLQKSLPFFLHTWDSACTVAKLEKWELSSEKYDKECPLSRW